MLLQKESSGSHVVIKAYEPGKIKLNIGISTDPVLLINGEKQDFSGADVFKELQLVDIEPFLNDKPEIIIIGTGEKHQILPIAITKAVNDLGIAIEAMASRQACHTYQVLTYEQRRVYSLIYP